MSFRFLKPICAWTLAVLLGGNFIASGWPKIFPSESMVQRFANWGYSELFLVVIGILELIGGILLFYSRTAFWGSLVIVCVMTGAVYTHITTKIGTPEFAIICLLLALTLAALRFRDGLFLKRPNTVQAGLQDSLKPSNED